MFNYVVVIWIYVFKKVKWFLGFASKSLVFVGVKMK